MRVTLPEAYIAHLSSYLGLDLAEPVPRVLREHAECVAEMSHGLKKKDARPSFIGSTYLNDERYRKAYLLYFTTSNLLKIHFPLSEIGRSDFFSHDRVYDILDLGAGTGAMTLGLSWWAQTHPKTNFNLTAIDASASALSEMQKFYHHCGFTQPLMTRTADLMNLKDPGSFDLIVAGNVLNELDPAGEQNLIGILEQSLKDDGFVILIEPALMTTSRRLLQLRNHMLEMGWYLFAPCFTRKPCPALVREDDWCHHSLDWERPEFIRMMDDMIGHVKKSLKFSYLILSKSDRHLSDGFSGGRNWQEQFRMVSDRIEEKGRSRCYFCNDRGRIEVMRQKRDRSASNEAWEDLERYDVVQVSEPVEKKTYVQVEKGTRVTRL